MLCYLNLRGFYHWESDDWRIKLASHLYLLPILTMPVKFSIYLSFLSIHPSIHLGHYSPFVGLWPLFSFLVFYTVSKTRMGNQPIARRLPTHRATLTQNKRTQRSVPQMGFEHTIPVSEQVKRFHALDCAVAVISNIMFTFTKNLHCLTQK
jgi:hypothetical protein